MFARPLLVLLQTARLWSAAVNIGLFTCCVLGNVIAFVGVVFGVLADGPVSRDGLRTDGRAAALRASGPTVRQSGWLTVYRLFRRHSCRHRSGAKQAGRRVLCIRGASAPTRGNTSVGQLTTIRLGSEVHGRSGDGLLVKEARIRTNGQLVRQP